MHLIVVAHQKGGVGKSTICHNLLYCLQETSSVAVLDMDIQGSLIRAKDLTAEDAPIFPLPYDLESIKEMPYDYVLVDTPPYIDYQIRDVLDLADLVLIPTRAGYYDVISLQDMVDVVQNSHHNNPKLKSRILLNMVNNRLNLTGAVKDLIDSFQIPLMDVHLSYRTAYGEGAIGKSAWNSYDKKARREILEFCEELISILNDEQKEHKRTGLDPENEFRAG